MMDLIKRIFGVKKEEKKEPAGQNGPKSHFKTLRFCWPMQKKNISKCKHIRWTNSKFANGREFRLTHTQYTQKKSVSGDGLANFGYYGHGSWVCVLCRAMLFVIGGVLECVLLCSFRFVSFGIIRKWHRGMGATAKTRK